MTNYTPVSCELYDKLEAIATLHRTSQITYRNEAGNPINVESQIVDGLCQRRRRLLQASRRYHHQARPPRSHHSRRRKGFVALYLAALYLAALFLAALYLVALLSSS